MKIAHQLSAFLLVIATTAACGAAPDQAHNSYVPPPISQLPVEGHLHFSFLNPGVTMDLVNASPEVIPMSRRLRVKNGPHVFFLDSLGQLNSLVHIDTPKDALAFVRLRTSRAYMDNYHSVEVEIISQSQSIQASFAVPAKFLGPAFMSPHVGTPGIWFVDPKYTIVTLPSGWLGVLSDRDYKIRGFTPPVVRQTTNGFQIDHWVCGFISPKLDLPHTIEKWREIVGPTGSYEKHVLVSMKVRRYRHGNLSIPWRL